MNPIATYTGPRTICIVLEGPHKNKIGWFKGTWADKEAMRARWNVPPTGIKVFVHGVASYALAIPFSKVAEATQLQIACHEAEQGR